MRKYTRRALLVGACSSLIASKAAGDIVCAQYDYSGLRRCTVGLQNVPVVIQECQQWCWAACIELAFRTQGLDVPQQVFVERIYGNSNTCRTASGPQISQAATGQWENRNGDQVTTNLRVILDYDHGIVNSFDPLSVVRDELENGRVVIAGTLGHAICITAMEYVENQFGNRQLLSLTVRDPWPTSGNRYFMSPQQFYNGRLLAAIGFS